MAVLLDTRGFAKPSGFSGQDGDWVSLQFTFLSYCGLLDDDYENYLDFVAAHPSQLVQGTFGADQATLSKQLYHMLVMLCSQGRAVTIMMNVERHNGYEAWRRLKQEYEPNLPGRWATMLSSLISPSWTSDGMRWREEFQQWEVDLARYEAQSGTRLPAAVRIAVVQRHAPPEVREAVRESSRIRGDDYAKLKQVALDYVISGLTFTSGGAVSSTGGTDGDWCD